jgi:hypothetical protein
VSVRSPFGWRIKVDAPQMTECHRQSLFTSFMKRLFWFALALAALPILGAERDIYDIMYLPRAGTTFGMSSFGYSHAHANGSGDIFSLSSDAFWMNQTVGHSFTDKFSLSGNIGYLTSKSTHELEGYRLTSKQVGWSDPSLNARFRLSDDGLLWDVMGGALIESGKSYHDQGRSNNKRGVSEFTLGTQVGKKTDSLQWAFHADLTRVGAQETENTSSSGRYVWKLEPYYQCSIGGQLLNRVGSRSFIRSGATFSAMGLGLTTEDLYKIYRVGTAYEHVCSKDLILRAGINYSVRDTWLTYIHQIGFTIGAGYQF